MTRLVLPAAVAAFACCAAPDADAVIAGRVLRADTKAPLSGISVTVQADLAAPVVVTNANGEFTLNVAPAKPVNVAAYKTYDHAPGAQNYSTATAFAVDGKLDVEIRLPPLPNTSEPNYQPPSAALCGACHVTQVEQWSDSRHANAARNVWVRDLYSGDGTPGGGAGYVFVQTHDPGNSGFCATCHAPLQDVFTPGQLAFNQISTPAGLDGVSCLGCHQIADVDPGKLDGLHHVGGKSDYRFPESKEHPTQFHVFGALPDVDAGTMRNLYTPLFRDALLCAGCHQYNNPTTGAPGQNTYLEWLESPYAQPGPNFRVCQDCHMPPAAGPGTIATTSTVIRPAVQRRNHQFGGSTPENLRDAILLRAQAQQVGARLEVEVEVENRGAGHAFPAGVSIRNAFVLVEARIGTQPMTLGEGPVLPFWVDDDVPGTQPGDFAGRPGKGYAKILEGRINGQGPVVRPVLFIDAEQLFSNTVIPSGTTDRTVYRFPIPEGVDATATVTARLVYRRAFRALAVTKGWTETPFGGPVEIEIASVTRAVPVRGPIVHVPVPALSWLAMLALAGLLAWAAARAVRPD